ncbi:GNAT family N-acetyltransferase [Lentilactobacillus diolivorans]|uniref:N-acetyltransferase domain-containing protein n=2 Tax=Lentilactobacillus diolivorans TaxID=179838 RepID=A0A0R1S765_9LACO|nr:GNAT family N-acetyltransferase [Lentilactobacillus diolivorans]KRL64775.1 hypothetical protein FC85_GL000828 [Lentilactobacillus diolivorans DSM 14421]GEP24678.1 N-acetyltransferase [Lentilactobacillus diolivorans]
MNNQITFNWHDKIDIPQLKSLYQSVGWTNYLVDFRTTVAAYRSSSYLSVKVAGELVGMIRIITDQQTIIYIQDLLVRPEFQRRKIGTRLVNLVLKRYREVGQVVLMTDQTEKTARFYQSLGFIDADSSGYGHAFVIDRR